MIRENIAWVAVLFAFLFVGCISSISRQKDEMGYLTVQGDKFVDAHGRQVVLNGINHVIKDPAKNYLHADDEALFKQFKQWGFNCVRYGIIWDGLEPEPGVINETYLTEIDKRVKWAEENGLWLMLDMHQDLFSRKYSDGAPLWATLDEGEPHIKGDVWSDAYLISPAIHRVFDNFWNNAKAPDGVGIQDHYISVWKLLAERYANSPSVLGFDIMNEPFMGSGATEVLGLLFQAYGSFIAEQTGKIPTQEELLLMWGDEAKRVEALDALNNKELYLRIMNHAEPAVRAFETGALSDFYQTVRDSIRTVNDKQILFLEHSYFCNLGVKSTFKIPTNKNGKKDPLVSYAPHGYDLVTDTKGANSPGANRVDVIFDQIFLSAAEKQVPVIVGEWGAFYMGAEYKKPTEQLVSIFEKHKAGQAYWCWWQKIEAQDYFLSTVARPYPMATNGELVSYANTWDDCSFRSSWNEGKGGVSTRIYLPDATNFDKRKIKLVPQSDILIIPIPDSKAVYVEITPIGGARSVTFNY